MDIKFKKHKILFISASILLALIIFFLVLFQNGHSTAPTADEIYEKAENHIKAKEYDLAEECMAEISEHENITLLETEILLSKYNDALKSADYDKAEELLSMLTNHSNYNEMQNKLTLLKGKEAFNLKDYEIAEELLLTIELDEEAKKMLEEIIYMNVLKAKEKDDFETALNLLSEIPNHIESENIKTEILFSKALEEIDLGDYKEAYVILNQIPNHPNSSSLCEIIKLESRILEFIIDSKISGQINNNLSFRVQKVEFIKASDEKLALFITMLTEDNVKFYALYTDMNDVICKRYYILEETLSNPKNNSERVKAALFNAYMKKEKAEKLFDISRINYILNENIEMIYIEE